MYAILQELKARNLVPAIEWARSNSVELEARGSNLEFELSKLQYVWLFKGPSVNGLPDDDANGKYGALAYGRQHFVRFQARHLSEIQQLVSAMIYASNLAGSPYSSIFATNTAFTDVAASFTREFCSLLGLSAESPLYIAATAGALALPRLMKYIQATKSRGTEWTTVNELAFETPLPERMVYHSIFVCPVSKEQTTDANPPHDYTLRACARQGVVAEAVQEPAVQVSLLPVRRPVQGRTTDHPLERLDLMGSRLTYRAWYPGRRRIRIRITLAPAAGSVRSRIEVEKGWSLRGRQQTGLSRETRFASLASIVCVFTAQCPVLSSFLGRKYYRWARDGPALG